MQDEETHRPTADERIAHQARTWRRSDKAAIASKCDVAKQRAEFRERQKLRQVVDTLGDRASKVGGE